jgi:hypothetical protein
MNTEHTNTLILYIILGSRLAARFACLLAGLRACSASQGLTLGVLIRRLVL